MIIPMKKIFLVVQDKDVVPALDVLRDFGAVHVEHIQKPSGARVQEIQENISRLERVIAVLSQLPASVEQIVAGDAGGKAVEILEWMSLVEQIKGTLASRQNVLQQWEPWGDFSPSDIGFLQSKGIFIQFVEVPGKGLARAPAGVVLHPVFVKKGIAYCLAISREKVNLPYPVFFTPSAGVAELRRQQDLDRKRLFKAEQNIKQAAVYLSSFHQTLNSLLEDLMFEEICAGRSHEERLAILKGFCPAATCADLERLAREESWGCLIEDPSSDDRVPTLLKNPKPVELVKPVFDFMSIIPGYREADVSFCFLFFFSVFFGMLIGDAGYGIIFAVLAFFLHRKMRTKISDPTAFYLVYVLSACTIVWGFLTGTFFGVSLFGNFVKPAAPWLGNEKNVQLLCFLIGALHLTIAHVWRGLRKGRSLLILSDVGWIAIVWAAYFYAQQFILSVPVPSFVNPMVFIAFIVIILFSQPFQDIVKDVGGFAVGILLTVLTVISTLIDVISYIRLFAVGTAGLALAEAFNQMAIAMGFHNLFLGLGAIVILVAGHLLNVLLGIMAVMVHGLRLNILEFSGHLSLEWSGVPYSPFRRLHGKVKYS